MRTAPRPTRPPPRLASRRLLLAAVAAILAGGAAPAGAVPTTCPAAEAPTGTVSVSAPAAGATVSGAVTVRATAGSPAGLSRAELFAGDALVDFQTFDPPLTGAELALRWDASATPAGPATLTVVLCGGGGGAPRLLQAGTVDVTVQPPVSPPPTPARLTRAPAQDRPTTGPPWVGAAVAAGGMAALLAVTAASRRRAAPHDPVPVVVVGDGDRPARRRSRPGRE